MPLDRKKRRPRRLLALDEPAPPPPPSGPFIRDPANFALLVERYQYLVFRYVYGMFRDYHLAQDLAQEIFMKVYTALSTYNVRYPFSTWLLRVAHNHAVDYKRRSRFELVSLDAKIGDTTVADSLLASSPAASTHVEVSHLRDAIEEAIFSLEPDYRSALQLRYVEGIKMEDIAYVLGIPIGTVKSRINRARLILQKKLDATHKT